MKKISAALKAHLAQPYQTMSTCWRVVQASGASWGFTDHDQDINISGWTSTDAALNGAYAAATGFTATDVQTTDSLNVDNLELHGMLVSPSITDAHLRAGLWDYAHVIIFQVNWADLTMGPLYERVGRLGEVKTGLGGFQAEIRGLTEAYARTLCELTSPACRANLGDARCKVNLTGFTVTGTVSGTNPNNLTWYDPALTQPGPSTGVSITGISNANPCVVTMANATLNLSESEPITLSGIVGMPLLNEVTVAHNPSGSTFELRLDTTDTAVWGTYSSGGAVTPYGGSSGYFDFGLVTWTGGANTGLKMEVKAYVPGQVTLQLPMPYPITAGDTYSMHAGCDKLLATCRDRFSNLVNMRAEPYLPGMDKLMQVGRNNYPTTPAK